MSQPEWAVGGGGGGGLCPCERRPQTPAGRKEGYVQKTVKRPENGFAEVTSG